MVHSAAFVWGFGTKIKIHWSRLHVHRQRSHVRRPRLQIKFVRFVEQVPTFVDHVRRQCLHVRTFAGNVRMFVGHVLKFAGHVVTWHCIVEEIVLPLKKGSHFTNRVKKNRIPKTIYLFILYFLYLCLSHSISIIYLTYYQFHYNIIHKKH